MALEIKMPRNVALQFIQIEEYRLHTVVFKTKFGIPPI